MFVQPSTYQVRLTVDGRTYRQAVVVRMDPRVKTPPADLALQFKLSRSVDTAIRQVSAARTDLAQRAASATGDGAGRLQAIARELQTAFTPLQELFESLQEADLRPTPAIEAAAADALKRVDEAMTKYKTEIGTAGT